MRWLPKRRKARIMMGAAAGLLVVGAAVGAAGLGGTSSPGRGIVPPSLPGGAGLSQSVGGATDSAGLPGMVASGPAFADSTAPVGSALRAGSSGAASGGGASGGDTAGSATDLPPEPALEGDGSQVVKTATLEVKVKEHALSRARARVLSLVSAAGGFVQGTQTNDGSAILDLRVPAERFESVLTQVRRLGEVRSESVSGRDVSGELVDIDARLRNWRAQETLLLDLMNKAKTVAESVEVQRELAGVQQNIEQLAGRQRLLQHQVTYSSISLSVIEPGVPSPAPPRAQSALARAWDRAFDAGLAVVGGTLVTLGALVPLAVIVGLPVLIGWGLLRRRRESVAIPPVPAG